MSSETGKGTDFVVLLSGEPPNQALATNVALHQFEIKASRIGNGIDTATQPRVWISGEDEAVLFRQIGVVVAQIEVEGLVSEGHPACQLR